MPQIQVTTIVRTTYEVPDGVGIERIRHLSLGELSEAEEQTEAVVCMHDQQMSQIFLGAHDALNQSVEHRIDEL